jgi:hypothetical protein
MEKVFTFLKEQHREERAYPNVGLSYYNLPTWPCPRKMSVMVSSTLPSAVPWYASALSSEDMRVMRGFLLNLLPSFSNRDMSSSMLVGSLPDTSSRSEGTGRVRKGEGWEGVREATRGGS